MKYLFTYVHIYQSKWKKTHLYSPKNQNEDYMCLSSSKDFNENLHFIFLAQEDLILHTRPK